MNKPIVLVIMDGVGRGDGGPGDAVAQARTPHLDQLLSTCPVAWLKAHGTAVGLPSDEDMGNSEVGHNALGCGQIYAQGARLVAESIGDGTLFASDTWCDLVQNCLENQAAFHFLGLLSDGNVHSNIAHLLAMLRQAKAAGVRKAYCHILLDGRDVPATSALEYVQQLEEALQVLSQDGCDYAIASGGGRMQITMDRYEADWSMVERGWKIHVLGEGRCFASAAQAIESYRQELQCIDQDLPGFVIARDGQPLAPIANGDSVVLFNFRGDRALEISRAFDSAEFTHFPRPGYTGVLFAGMLQYDSDLNIPQRYLAQPPQIHDTLTELLVAHQLRQFALSETQKYGHVTYFWNGNRSGKVSEELETYMEIPSDVIPFDQKPRMKADEITEQLLQAMESHQFQFLRCNYPNGDMVGHTGVMAAVVEAMQAVDDGLGRLMEAAERLGYTLLVTADHGNADQMLQADKKGKLSVRTAHSLNPVPFIVYDPTQPFALKSGEFGLANVAPTIVDMLGLQAPACWEESMLEA